MILRRIRAIGLTPPYGTHLLDSIEGQIMNPIIELQEQEIKSEVGYIKEDAIPTEMKIIKDWHTTGYMEVRM